MICKFCNNSMYLDDQSTLGKGKLLESYNCAYCGAVCDISSSLGKQTNEWWHNPNKYNYKDLKRMIIQLFKHLSNENNNFNDLIAKIETISNIEDFIDLITKEHINFDEQQIQLGKEFIINKLDETNLYGEITKRSLKSIISSNTNLVDILLQVYDYLNNHNVSL